jgi:orotidine-5'-phosphate decarboxylase
MSAAWRVDRSMGQGLATRIDARERLILALDVPTFSEAKSLVERLDGIVSFFKIGLWMHIVPGILDLAIGLVQSGKRVFWDVKGGDIPESLRGYALRAGHLGFNFLTIQGNGDVTDEAIRAAVDGKRGTDLKVLLVTVLTSMNDEDVRRVYRAESVVQLVDERVRRAIHLGCDGVIASGREAEMIRRIASEERKPDLLLVTPGIRPQGTSANDQKRVATPFEAILNGADYLVVGRPILEARDPKATASAIVEEMQRGFEGRL